MFNKKTFKNFDFILLLVMIALFTIGIVAIASATVSSGSAIAIKQLVFFVAGIVLMFFVIFIDYNLIGNLYWYIYGFNLLILLLVRFIGKVKFGAQSWIEIGGISIQPSEFSKIFIIIFVAKLISIICEDSKTEISKIKNLAIVIGLAAVPLGLILLQPDFGTGAVIVAILIIILFAAKLDIRYFLAGFTSIAALSVPAYYFLLKDYQRKRILTFLYPELDPQGSGFQVIQSKIAIGSGNFLGKGLFQGTQTQLGYLPFKESDFIFSVIGEEMGFVWAIVLLLLFGIMLLKLVNIAKNSKDLFGSLIVVGVAAMIGIHVLENIGMTIGLMPVTGIPLPFISAGGSSLWANMIGIGLALNVGMRRQKLSF